MNWPRVIEAILDRLRADSDLLSIYGDAMLAAGAIPARVPLLTWSLVSVAHSEQWEPLVVQFDQWCADVDDLLRSEQLLMRYLSRELPELVGDIMMWLEFVDSDTLAEPTMDGFFGRAVRFRFTPLRERYDPASMS